MENRLIVTRSDDSQNKIAELTHPVLKKYADRCNADFLVLKDKYKDFHIHYRILKLYDLFDEYDKIYSVDTDVVIKKNCPNIFEVVPEGYYVASIFEDVGSRKDDRRGRLKAVQSKFGDVGYDKDYINTGSALFCREAREIFNIKNESECWSGLGFDDVELWWRIHKLHFNIFELPHQYNFMSMFSEEWNGNAPRVNAYVIHYAGNGGFLIGRSREDIIKEDITLFKKYGAI